MADLFLTPYVRTMWRLLAERLGADGRLAVFGAGAHTRWLLSITSDLPRAHVRCVVDDDPKTATLYGYPVRTADEVDSATVDIVLISSDRWESRLADRARQVWGDCVEIVRLYAGLPEGPYDKRDHRAEALDRLASMSPGRRATPRAIVMIAERPRSREVKTAFALREAGWRITLLHRRDPTFDAARYFDEVRRFGTDWEALRIACDQTAVAFQVMVNSDYRLAELFLRHRPGPVVVDSYDLMAGMYTDAFFRARPAYADELARERHCLESADGLVCRSGECGFLQRERGYVPAPSVDVADGCWNLAERTAPQRGDDIHVVYVGKLVPESESADPFAAEGHKLWLAEALARQEIHLHLFPDFDSSAGAFEDRFAAYREIERRTPFVHFHAPVAPDRLIAALREFDMGIFVYNNAVAPAGDSFPLTNAKLRHCASNKFYDYLDAGLPILHNAASDSALHRLVAAHGAGVSVLDVPVERWGGVIRSSDRKRLRDGAAAAREAYDVRRSAATLTMFYERVRRDYDADRIGASADSLDWDHANRRRDHRPALV